MFCFDSRLTFVFDNWRPLLTCMSNSSSVAIETEVTLISIAWYKLPSAHVVRPLMFYPIRRNTIVQQGNAQVNLEVMSAGVLTQVNSPILVDNPNTSTVDDNSKACMHHPIQHPTEDPKIISVCAYTGGVVSTVPVIPVDSVDIFDVLCLCFRSIDSDSPRLPFDVSQYR